MSQKNSHLQIRPALPADSALILQFIKELAIFEKLEHQVRATEDDIRQGLFGPRPYAEVLIADMQGQPAGFCLYFHNFSTFLGRLGIYIEDIFVRDEFRGSGIGRAFFSEMGRIAEQRNCGRIEWWVLNWNEPAIEFYKKLKAKPMDEWTVYRLTEEHFAEL